MEKTAKDYPYNSFHIHCPCCIWILFQMLAGTETSRNKGSHVLFYCESCFCCGLMCDSCYYASMSEACLGPLTLRWIRSASYCTVPIVLQRHFMQQKARHFFRVVMLLMEVSFLNDLIFLLALGHVWFLILFFESL